jgi:hypothetical protein
LCHAIAKDKYLSYIRREFNAYQSPQDPGEKMKKAMPTLAALLFAALILANTQGAAAQTAKESAAQSSDGRLYEVTGSEAKLIYDSIPGEPSLNDSMDEVKTMPTAAGHVICARSYNAYNCVFY